LSQINDKQVHWSRPGNKPTEISLNARTTHAKLPVFIRHY
jgi:hypothetical protein